MIYVQQPVNPKQIIHGSDPQLIILTAHHLKEILNEVSNVPDMVKYIPEIVINGLNQKVVKESMKAGIEAVIDFDDVLHVSAGNYKGKLGEYRIDLKELFV